MIELVELHGFTVEDLQVVITKREMCGYVFVSLAYAPDGMCVVAFRQPAGEGK